MVYKCEHCGCVMDEPKINCPHCGAALNIELPKPKGENLCRNCKNTVKIDDYVCSACGSLLLPQIIFWMTLVSIFVLFWSAVIVLIIFSSLHGNSTATPCIMSFFGLIWLGSLWWLWREILKLRKARSLHDNFVSAKINE